MHAILLALLVLMPAAVLAAPPVLKLYTEELPPYNTMLADGHIGGSSTEKVEHIFKDAKLGYNIEMTSWARALETARTHTDTCVYSTARTPEREASFKWIGILAHNEGVLFALADRSQPPPTNIAAVMGARIGGYHSSASTTYMVKRGYNVILSANHEISLKNLLAGRLDYWLATRSTGAAIIDKLGVQGKVVVVMPVVNLELYLACNPAVDPTLIQRLQQSYLHLQGDGTLAAIDKQHSE